MNPKHLKIRIAQCIELSKASSCPRRKFGALLVDPERNVILMDGYNGGPRGGGSLCKGSFCEREGLTETNITIQKNVSHALTGEYLSTTYSVCVDGHAVKSFDSQVDNWPGIVRDAEQCAHNFKAQMLRDYPGVESGTHMETGCHHAELNVLANAANNGVSTRGAWLIVTGEPCLMCAKYLHHAGITKVITVRNGYLGRNGVDYLKEHGIPVAFVEGPEDPRISSL